MKIRYIVSDKKIAKVSSDGSVKAKKAGKCTITLVTQNGISKKISVKVYDKQSKTSAEERK